jgi:hypothetical protein
MWRGAAVFGRLRLLADRGSVPQYASPSSRTPGAPSGRIAPHDLVWRECGRPDPACPLRARARATTTPPPSPAPPPPAPYPASPRPPNLQSVANRPPTREPWRHKHCHHAYVAETPAATGDLSRFASPPRPAPHFSPPERPQAAGSRATGRERHIAAPARIAAPKSDIERDQCDPRDSRACRRKRAPGSAAAEPSSGLRWYPRRPRRPHPRATSGAGQGRTDLHRRDGKPARTLVTDQLLGPRTTCPGHSQRSDMTLALQLRTATPLKITYVVTTDRLTNTTAQGFSSALRPHSPSRRTPVNLPLEPGCPTGQPDHVGLLPGCGKVPATAPCVLSVTTTPDPNNSSTGVDVLVKARVRSTTRGRDPRIRP